MARKAKGKDAWAIDDRSGFKIRYKDLRTEWTGLRVHKNEVEPKHPQLELGRLRGDAMTLENPRPDNDDMGTATQTLAEALIDRGLPPTFGAT